MPLVALSKPVRAAIEKFEVKRLVDDAVVAKSAVVVAWLVVALSPVKFCKVVEPVARMLSACKVPVAVRLLPVMFPFAKISPATESFANGDVVPMPRLPAEVNTELNVPAVLYISKIFAVCPEAGKSASVVVAALPESIASFAYGVVVAPMPTESVVVASVISPILLVVQPPPVEAPETEILPHEIAPEPSVWSA